MPQRRCRKDTKKARSASAEDSFWLAAVRRQRVEPVSAVWEASQSTSEDTSPRERKTRPGTPWYARSRTSIGPCCVSSVANKFRALRIYSLSTWAARLETAWHRCSAGGYVLAPWFNVFSSARTARIGPACSVRHDIKKSGTSRRCVGADPLLCLHQNPKHNPIQRFSVRVITHSHENDRMYT